MLWRLWSETCWCFRHPAEAGVPAAAESGGLGWGEVESGFLAAW
jgi:hypothetical protein